MTFGFDERYAMFDVTPVENQFILELLPGARGEYVKVYLYGLMKCYHPEADSNLDEMAHELNMTPEEIERKQNNEKASLCHSRGSDAARIRRLRLKRRLG